MFPSCSHCLKKGVKCEVNPSVKKRGRPFGTTKENIEKKKQDNNKREVQTIQPVVIETPQKKMKIPSKEIKLENDNSNMIFFQVPIDINWDFSFQNSLQSSNSNLFFPQQQQPAVIKTETFQEMTVSSPVSCESEDYYSPSSSPSSDLFEFNVENLDFDHFNSFLDEIQFC